MQATGVILPGCRGVSGVSCTSVPFLSRQLRCSAERRDVVEALLVCSVLGARCGPWCWLWSHIAISRAVATKPWRRGVAGTAHVFGAGEMVADLCPSYMRRMLTSVRPGMDLSKIALPTFVLEPRSMLERVTDFFSHPDLIFG